MIIEQIYCYHINIRKKESEREAAEKTYKNQSYKNEKNFYKE